MIFLFLSILSSSLIAVIFKIQDKYEIKLFPVIIINYVFAVAWGLILNKTKITSEIFESNWIHVSVIIGIALLVMFYMLGYSTQKVGISVTTISKEMSVVLPISFSIFFYKEELTSIKEIGVLLALTAVFLSVYKKKEKGKEFDMKYFFLPIVLMFGIGFIDSMLKFSLEEFDVKDNIPLFSAISFAVAGIVGLFVSFVNEISIKDFLNWKTILTGAIIGTANFGSMYFLFLALARAPIQSTAVYGINNVGIITVSILAAVLIFKESISVLNRIGILLAIFAIMILSGMIS
jgi:drug/metabolite transporter (DMT)-like permease